MLTLFSHSNSDHMVRKASSLIQDPGLDLIGSKEPRCEKNHFRTLRKWDALRRNDVLFILLPSSDTLVQLFL